MRSGIAFVALVLAVTATGAQAKGPVDLQLCGREGCIAVAQTLSERVFTYGRDDLAVPPAASAYYALRWTAGATAATAYWIPHAHVLRWLGGADAQDGWTNADATTTAELASAAASLRPFQPPEPRCPPPGSTAAGLSSSDSDGGITPVHYAVRRPC
jgi:hypothetical protein